MAFAGTLNSALIYFANGDYAVDNTGKTNLADPQQGFYLDPFGAGAHTESLVDVGRASGGGYRQVTFVEDFYNRVHFVPSPFTFGPIASDTTRVMAVWNAHLVPNDFTALGLDGGINVTYGGDSIPFTFGPLEEVDLPFTALQNGTPAFSEFTTFTFSLKDPYNILFTGDRAVLIERGPNWRDPMVETYEFRTEIVHRSRSGKEQRRALRQEPRRTLAYTLSTWGNTRRDAEGLLTRWRRRTVVTPVWPWRTTTSTTAVAATTTLNLDYVPNWAVPDMNVVIEHPGMPARINGTIASVGASSIVLVIGLAYEVPAGATVTQMLTARVRDAQKVDRVTADVAEVPFVFDITPGIDPIYTPPAASVFHDGYEVVLTDPNWSAGIEETWDMPLDVVDANWGVKVFYEYQDFVQYTMRLLYSGLRETKVQDVIDLFYRQKGMRGEFWYPTRGRDVEPGYQLDESASTIRIAGSDFATDWSDQSTNQAIIVWLTDGTYFTRSVTDLSTTTDVFGTDSVITLDDVWPYDIPTSDVRKISWMMRCRFATDTLRVEWLNDEKANVQFSLSTLEVL